MKKFIGILFFTLMIFTSCNKKYDYATTITYKIYYPNNTVIKQYTGETTDKPSYCLGSDRGTNYLYFVCDGDNWVGPKSTSLEHTSAPIEVVSFVKVKK